VLSRAIFVFLVLLQVSFSANAAAETFRILNVNSYTAEWSWTREQIDGFIEGICNPDLELRTVDLDAKNMSGGRPDKIRLAAEIAETWKPHLVFLTDDTALEKIGTLYADSPVPVVFSGIDGDPSDYGLGEVRNMTGAVEREHFTGTIRLLKNIWPGEIRRIAVILDSSPTWDRVRKRMEEETARYGIIEIAEWIRPETFEEFKTSMLRIQNTVDAIGVLGIFNFSDGGTFADYGEVLRWTAENSSLPDFSFWSSRVERGTLCALMVSGTEQGRLAGKIAGRILVEKVPPSSILPEQTTTGHPVISLARAKKLGIGIRSGILLESTVFPRFIWDK